MAPFQTLDHHTDIALENETKVTLNEKTWAELIAFCHERGLNAEGDKPTLIQALLDWKLNTRPVPAPSTPRLFSTDGSNSPRQDKISSVYLSSLFSDDDASEIKYEELEIGKKLGSGGFKDCYAGKYKGEPVAIGELRVVNFSEADIKETKHEINVLKQLRHENIIQFIGVSTNSKHLCIITELCEHGDMFDYMRKVPRPSFTQEVMFMHDIALGITYLHTRRPSIIHRDLKSMNILISSNLRAKINDFGLARIRPKANASMHTQCGTPNWQAPEFWTPNPSYTEKVDVYAAGLIFWEILTWGEAGYPYQNYSEHQLYEAVRDKNVRPPIDNLRKNYPTTLLELVQDMWQKNPKERPSMSYVVDSLVQYLS
ncbi:kinase-like domain-containing protein [Glomus cerebriforme]|uniref:Kinase-like domain-containing protein n=1 Tax=Glomus cerebriforme TaxID=658196 RepID=A0A397S6T4_9GLOM|nr:kinase-like domain-containing protein [Glomus cerebriforme]